MYLPDDDSHVFPSRGLNHDEQSVHDRDLNHHPSFHLKEGQVQSPY